MDLEKLRVFYYVAKAGSFRKAAEELNVAQPSLSRSIQVLEHTLKTKLFLRHPRGVLLTREGEVWFKYMQRAMAELETARTLVAEDGKKVQGELKITTTYGFASAVLFPHLVDFAKLYPDVNLHLMCNDENLDLTIREADVAIRPKEKGAPNLIQTLLTTSKLQIYASPQYLEKFGKPKNPSDLDTHRLIIFADPQHYLPYGKPNWLLRVGAPHGYLRKPYMTVNSVECLYEAAINSLGIITLSNNSSFLKNNNLIQILENIEPPQSHLYYVYPKNLKSVRSVRALEGYLLEAFSNNKNILQFQKK
jgi:DNA-binding transcriptional LysR family regulator